MSRSGYTGQPHIRSASVASTNRIDVANKGKKSSRDDKLQMVMDYVRDTATRYYDGDVRKVTCPPSDEWSRLSAGRGAVLPNESQLNLYANDALRKVAQKFGGDMRQAYIAVAKYRLLHP